MSEIEDLVQRYKGCMVGAAVGDALGMQVEGLTRSEIEQLRGTDGVVDYGRAPMGHPNHKLLPGQYTDDTEQMILLSESIIERGRFDVQVFSDKLRRWGERLSARPELNRLVGETSTQAIKNLLNGADWRGSGIPANSCGSAMRAAPIGLSSRDLSQVVRDARLSSCPTHTSKGSIAGAVTIATAVYLSLEKTPDEEILSKIIEVVGGIDKALRDRLKEISEMNPAIEELFPGDGVSNSVYETVPAALFCATRYSCFDEAVIAAVKIGGDTDSVACMTGAITGARHGINAIPRRWRRGLERAEYIEGLALQLLEAKRKISKDICNIM